MIKQYLVHYKYKDSGELLYTKRSEFTKSHNIEDWWEAFLNGHWCRDMILVDISYLGEVNE